jgi:indolepyruvate ferredoxin oxidoreductase beta subunit
METVRYWPFLSEEGTVIVNDHRILPPAVFTGKQDYPEGAIENVKERVPQAVVIKGDAIAQEIGNLRVVNVIFLGALSNYLDIPPETFEEVLNESLKPELLDINLKAFNKGRALTAS